MEPLLPNLSLGVSYLARDAATSCRVCFPCWTNFAEKKKEFGNAGWLVNEYSTAAKIEAS